MPNSNETTKEKPTGIYPDYYRYSVVVKIETIGEDGMVYGKVIPIDRMLLQAGAGKYVGNGIAQSVIDVARQAGHLNDE